MGVPHLFCPRCDRAFDIDTGAQIENFAWKKSEPGNFKKCGETTENDRINNWIAENVMGWTPLIRQPRWLAWSPASSVTDATYALEKWCDAEYGRGYITGRLAEDEGGKYFAKLTGYPEVIEGTKALAISRALCQATGMPEGESDEA